MRTNTGSITVSEDHQPDALDYVRGYYGLEFEVGHRIVYRYDGEHHGTVVGCRHAYLIVVFDEDSGHRWSSGEEVLLHPTWRVEYRGAGDRVE